MYPDPISGGLHSFYTIQVYQAWELPPHWLRDNLPSSSTALRMSESVEHYRHGRRCGILPIVFGLQVRKGLGRIACSLEQHLHRLS